MLSGKGLLSPERISLLESWENSGFNVDASVRVGADDATARENLARYLRRAPFSMDKIRHDPLAQTVPYKGKIVHGANRNFETFDPLDFLAALTATIPDRGEHLVRYYAYYSSVQRGRRRRQGREKVPLGPIPLSDDTASAKTARGNWARFIKKIFEVDPLICTECGGAMRIISFVTDHEVIRAILVHLSLWGTPKPRAPPTAARKATNDLEYVPCEE